MYGVASAVQRLCRAVGVERASAEPHLAGLQRHPQQREALPGPAAGPLERRAREARPSSKLTSSAVAPLNDQAQPRISTGSPTAIRVPGAGLTMTDSGAMAHTGRERFPAAAPRMPGWSL